MIGLMGYTKEDAAFAMVVIDRRRNQIVTAMAKVKRMRSWSASTKAMTLASYQRDLDALAKLHQALGQSYDLGGY